MLNLFLSDTGCNCKYCEKYSVSDLNDPADSFNQSSGGKELWITATVVPLVVAAIPFIARMVESSIKEVDAGVIEAARAMGASNIRIIVKVLLVEARTSLITGATIAIGTILGYSAMSGAVGGGGLGDIAIRYGDRKSVV